MATVIISKLGAAPHEPRPEQKEPETDELEVAAEEVLSALESKSPAALKEALKSFVQMCMDKYDEESDMPEYDSE